MAIVAGALAHRGLLAGACAGVALAAALGAFLSDQACFHLGRRFGGHPRLARLKGSAAAARLRAGLARHPVLPLVLFRFVWGTRIAGPLAFGASGVPPLRFLLLDLPACLAWGLLFAGIGFGLGLAVERAVGRLGLGQHLGLVALGIAALLAAAWALHRLRAGR